MPPTFETLTDAQAEALAIAHVRLFEHRIRCAREGIRGIRLEECQRYLATWEATLFKIRRFKQWRNELGPRERGEILSALACGDYDELMEEAAAPDYVQVPCTLSSEAIAEALRDLGDE